jgi:hypothetical protein
MKGDISELNHLKELLTCFVESTDLKVNFDKPMMIPINVTAARLDVSATTFGCSKALPSTYLGLTLSLTKPSVANFWPLVYKRERRLMAFSFFLSEAGRLDLTNAVLIALTNFCNVQFPSSQNYDQTN